MNFHKDILLVDIECTGLDTKKHEIIQLAAVLLDKKTLKEKKFFSTYVKPTKWKNRDPESMAINKIEYSQLELAPKIDAVISEFHKLFDPKKVILANYGGPLDFDFLRAIYKSLGKRWEFDYHFFNLWGLFFAYMASTGKVLNNKKFTGFSLDHFVKRFKIQESGNRHDALTDCRIEAEVLRRVMKELK